MLEYPGAGPCAAVSVFVRGHGVLPATPCTRYSSATPSAIIAIANFDAVSNACSLHQRGCSDSRGGQARQVRDAGLELSADANPRWGRPGSPLSPPARRRRAARPLGKGHRHRPRHKAIMSPTSMRDLKRGLASGN